MSISHEEFFRVVPRTLGLHRVNRENNKVIMSEQNRRLVIILSNESVRRIGSLALPATKLKLQFDGYSEAQVSTFMQRFDRVFQRGGG